MEQSFVTFVPGVDGSDIAAQFEPLLNSQWGARIGWTRGGAGDRTITGTTTAEGAGVKLTGEWVEWTYDSTTEPDINVVEGGPLETNITITLDSGESLGDLGLAAGVPTRFEFGDQVINNSWQTFDNQRAIIPVGTLPTSGEQGEVVYLSLIHI